jgi:predicted RNase H-like HicB family nuclease
MQLTIETEQEEQGHWIAEILEIPEVLAYGKTAAEARARAQALALRILADRLEREASNGTPLSISFIAA